MTTQLPQIRREQIPEGAVLCDYCSAKCCRYFALPLDNPESFEDWEFVRWFLLHEGAGAFKDDGQWYILFHSKCKHLQDDNRCGTYHTRPQICREYSTENCEYDDDWLYEQYLETAEQVVDYAEAVLSFGNGRVVRSPKPPLLPVI